MNEFEVVEREGLEKLPVYSSENNTAKIIVNANENPYDIPKNIKNKILKEIENTSFNRYPDITAETLRATIANELGFKIKNIQIGNGSSELLFSSAMAFGGSNRKIAYISPSFSLYEIYARLSDSIPVPFALDKDFSIDMDKIKNFIKQEKPSVLIICNPNNPTGNLYKKEDLLEIVKISNCLVLIDEAYMEFSEKETLIPFLKEYNNLAVLRTFSKAYGLAAMRVGYIVSNNESIIDAISKVLLPYHVNSITLKMAKIIYENKEQYKDIIENLTTERDILSKKIEDLGLDVCPSATNFIFLSVGKSKEQGKKLCKYLEENNISVRDFTDKEELLHGIRISIGTKDENAKVFETIKNYIRGQS